MERRGRTVIVFLLMIFACAAIGARLAYLQVVKRAELSARAERQQQRVVKLLPRRGAIFDRNGSELAVSLDVESVYGVPAGIDNPRGLSLQLSRILKKDPRSLERNLSGDRSFVWLSRKIDPSKADKIKKLDTKDVGLVLESRRFYPKKTLAGTVLGFTGMDNEGLEGVELAYDKELRGAAGWVLAEKDASGRMVFPGGPGFQYKLPKPGKDIMLTIDEVIQHITDKELDAALARSRAKSGVCMVMDPRTGEILALSVRNRSGGRPAFNPNTAQQHRPEEWRNRAVTDAFEPGSIFKPFLAAAAIEERVAHPYERFDCSAGSIKVADRVIRDATRHGVLTFTDVIAESSNVGTIKVAQRLGRQRFYKYITAFGFGGKTGIDIPGEATGLVKDYRLWSGVSIGSIAIGQEIGVTAMQMAAAYAALANGGKLMKPHIVSAVIDPDSGAVVKLPPTQLARVVSEDTSRKVNRMLARAVEAGTGQKARPSGYTAAGKTGTAQKIDATTGEYSKNEYVSSFAGFTPAASPRLVILVMIDSPEGVAWGGSVAAPAFKAVAEQALTYLHVPPDDKGGGMLLVAR